MPGFIGPFELILLGLFVLLLFGPKRLPEIGRSLGHGFRELKDSLSGSSEPALDPAAPSLDRAAPAPLRGDATATHFCHACGASLVAGARFCSSCGVSTAVEPSEAGAKAAP